MVDISSENTTKKGMEFPAVSHTRISRWGAPQYTRKGMLFFTVLFGFFGLHHLMLRSPQTMALFFIGNILSLGYWYWYDLGQLAYSSTKELNEFGLSFPWGPGGLAQGMWKSDTINITKNSESIKEPPNPLWFMLFFFLVPLGFVAPLVVGDTYGSLLRLVGSFLYIFYFIYDYFVLFVKPGELFEKGIPRFPFSLLSIVSDEYGESEKITGNPQSKESFFSYLKSVCLTGGILGPILAPILGPAQATVETAVATVDTAKATVNSLKTEVIDRVDRGVKIASQVGTLTSNVTQGVAKGIAKASTATADPTLLLQKGGGLSSTDSWVLGGIAAVLGGGFLLTTGRSLFDAVQHYKGPSDIPPNKS